MKGSILIILFFIAGVLLGRFDLLPDILLDNDFSIYALYVLMFIVGISIGVDKRTINAIRKQDLKIFLIPGGTILGTLLGVYLISFFYKKQIRSRLFGNRIGFRILLFIKYFYYRV